MDPNIIVISDEELEDNNSINHDDHQNPIIISDEEHFSDGVYDVSTPEVSLSPDEDENYHQPAVIQELSSGEDEYSTSSNDESDDEPDNDTLKRKHGQATKKLDTEQKKKKLEVEVEAKKVETVCQMILKCKKMMSLSKDTLLVKEGECSKDDNEESSQEINSDDQLPIQEHTLNNGNGDLNEEIKSAEVSDVANEENCFTNLIDLPKNDKGTSLDCDESKKENDIIKNVIETDDLIDGLKDKNDLINENNVTKNGKSNGDLKRTKYCSNESLFIETIDPEKEIASNIQTVSSEKEVE